MKNAVAKRTWNRTGSMPRGRFWLTLSACVLSLGLHSTAQAQVASFDCAKASTPTEHTICSMPSLGAKDVRMATIYQILQTVSPAVSGMVFREFRGGIQEQQVKWLKRERDICNEDRACLEQAYDQRIAALQKTLKENVGLTYGRMCDGD